MNNNERLYEFVKHADNAYIGFVLETEVALEYLEHLTEKGYGFEYTDASVAYLEKLEEHFDRLVVEVCDNEVFIFSFNGNCHHFVHYDMILVQDGLVNEKELNDMCNECIVSIEIDEVDFDTITDELQSIEYLKYSAKAILNNIIKEGIKANTHQKIYESLKDAYDLGCEDCECCIGDLYDVGYNEGLNEAIEAISELF